MEEFKKDEVSAKEEAPRGHYHPLSLILRDIVAIFGKLGFEVAEGPEIESEYYNFDTLNIPQDHPARDMWDTFWLKPRSLGKLLRTHTSPVQVRYMETHEAPFRIIAPGKAYRYEATDATHEAQFYQVEGLMIGKHISLGNLKGIFAFFFEELFGAKTEIRFRPSYFPFVVPGVEVDMSCFKCKGKNGSCSICKGTGWIEILGAGMVHPHVLLQAGINPRQWQGFAFGCGMERLAMLKYGVPDVRIFHNGDLRVVNQF